MIECAQTVRLTVEIRDAIQATFHGRRILFAGFGLVRSQESKRERERVCVFTFEED